MTTNLVNESMTVSDNPELALTDPPSTAHIEAQTSIILQISFEWLVYAVLVLLVVALRLADLDIVPMSDAEAVRALPAWHLVTPDAPGEPQAADSPLVFWLQAISFSLLGGTELAARLPGVIAGVLLTLMPLLFRERFGPLHTVCWSVLLAISPVAFIGARTTDPALWSMIFALALVWALWQHYDSRDKRYLLWGAGFAAGLIFLSEPGGLLVAIGLVATAALTLWLMIIRAPEERDTPGDDLLAALQTWWQSFSWSQMGLVVAAVVFIAGTGFFIYPTGLSIVAEAITGSFIGFVQTAQADAPPAHALLVLFIYEPLLLILSAISVGLFLFQSNASPSSRFVRVWTCVSLLLLLLYRGAGPGDALWVVVPLTWLVAALAASAIRTIDSPIFIFDDYFADGRRLAWTKWVTGVIVLALLMMLTLHLQEVGRGLMEMPTDSSFSIVLDARFEAARGSAMMLVFVTLLLIVGFFLAASFWGNLLTAQGYALGGLFFLAITAISTGWAAAVANADDPAEIWHVTAVSPDAYLLRASIDDIAARDTLGFSELAINVLVDSENIITSDGLVAWLLRDYENTTFAQSLSEVARDAIILVPASETEPNLGGSYVGQNFVLRRTLAEDAVRGRDLLAWLLQRRLRGDQQIEEASVLWLRLDVYDGVPLEERLRG